MTISEFKKKYATVLPHQPGVYKFIGEGDNVLYVGKAKDLKKRINSYFNKNQKVYKVKFLVKNAIKIDYTIVHSEQDALLLESTLIKRYQPRYNVMMKDGKSYVYIRIRNEDFPRVEFTRVVVRDGSVYYGPYTSKYKANILLDLIKKLFKIRTCKLNLSRKNIQAGKFKVCLEYHIKNCLAPCVGKQSKEEYDIMIEQAKNILKGHFKPVKDYIKNKMSYHAERLEFELAQEYKEKLSAFEDYQAKSTVVSTKIKDLDIFYLDTDEEYAYVNYLKVVNGSIIVADTVKMQKNLDEDKESLLRYAIIKLRDKYNSVSKELVLAQKIAITYDDVKITVPAAGDKKQLLEMSKKNVKYFMLQEQKRKALNKTKTTSAERILNTLKKDLQMKQMPMHIECFDNSNFQGSFPVASCVVFKNAVPSKKDYRHYNIKTVTGIDDFASMQEIVYRRYSRLIRENKDLPQLVIIDGGKGQLSAAMKSIKQLQLNEKITIIGIAKKLEEIYFPGDSIPLHINKKSESLKLIQQLRNEAHRFAITFHRNQRSKDFTNSELKNIKGVGDKTIEKLLKHFKSVKKIKTADKKELSAVVGNAMATKIINYFSR